MKKVITIDQFADELIQRIDNAKDIDCCKEELKNLASLAKKHMADKEIEVNWKD